ncbi:MAG: Swt1 family HEPN domain-containing protein [Candidatus Bathyarchaeia archaeon]
MNKVFQAICKKTWKTEPKTPRDTIYHRIAAFKRKSNIASKKLSEIVYAYEVMRIAVQKLDISKEELEELQEWLSKKPQQQKDIRQERKIIVTNKIRKKVVDAFGLPSNIWNEASRMAKAYPDMYLFENLVRHAVMTVLEKKYQKDWWNVPNVASNEIKRDVEKRKRQEKENRWHSKRGVHEIFYTNFGDLSRIVATNIKEFKKVFGDLQIEAEMKKLELSRNIIAHNNPLPPKETKRIEISLDDLRKQLDAYVKNK